MALRLSPIKLGVVGYGTGGRFFHTPFVAAAEGVELAGVVTRSPVRRAEVEQDWPGVPVFESLGALLDSGVDAVTITTPPETRRALVLAAIGEGVHVIADKPFAPTAEVGLEMAAAADAAGVLLSVFHNRRWDADIRTLAAVVEGGRLGELWRVHSRFDLDDPATLEAGPGGGLLRDIGSHVVDQMLWLLGDVRSVNAHLDWIELPTVARTLRSCSTSSTAPACGRRSSRARSTTSRPVRSCALWQQGQLSRARHRRPGTGDLRRPSAGRRSRAVGLRRTRSLGSAGDQCRQVSVPSEQGRYHDLYSAFAAAVRGEGHNRSRPWMRSARSRCSMRRASAPKG